MNPIEQHLLPSGMDPALLRQLQHAACIAELSPGVAHRLNNALAGTLSNLELITLEENLPKEVLDSHQWSQQAAWQAADLNRAFVEFITRSDTTAGPVDLDSLFAQVVQFFRRFSDRHVEVSHSPSPERIIAQASFTVLAESVVSLALLGQRLLPRGGSIKFSASRNAATVTVSVALDSVSPNPGVVHSESHRLLEWLTRSLAVTAGGTLETEMHDDRPVKFFLQLPGAA